VRDTPAEWPPRARVVVELDTGLDEVGDPCRRLVGEDARALAAEPATRAQCVAGVQAGIVAVPDRRRDAALREVAVRGEHRAVRKEENVGFRGGAKRGVEPGDASADDDQIRLFVHLHRRFSPQSR
jgi:hypothetical protein